jgi:hypothetical protein
MGAPIPDSPHSSIHAEAQADLSHQERQTLALEKIAAGIYALHADLQVLADAIRKLTNRVNGS